MERLVEVTLEIDAELKEQAEKVFAENGMTLEEWAVHNAEFLSHHHLVCTGTTGGLIRSAFDEKGVGAEITCMHSGPLGGSQRMMHNPLSSISKVADNIPSNHLTR